MKKYIKANRDPESEEVVVVIKGDIKYTGSIYAWGFYDCFKHYAKTDEDVCDACRSYLVEVGMDDVSELSANEVGMYCAEEISFEFEDYKNDEEYEFYEDGDSGVFEVFMAYELAEDAE